MPLQPPHTRSKTRQSKQEEDTEYEDAIEDEDESDGDVMVQAISDPTNLGIISTLQRQNKQMIIDMKQEKAKRDEGRALEQAKLEEQIRQEMWLAYLEEMKMMKETIDSLQNDMRNWTKMDISMQPNQRK